MRLHVPWIMILIGGFSFLFLTLTGSDSPVRASVGAAAIIGSTVNPLDTTLNPASFDLGSVGHGQKELLSFELINNSASPLEITNIRPSCGCMKMTTSTRFSIEPGQKQEIRFSLSLGRGWGNFSKKIDIYGAENRRLHTLPVKAMFHPGVRTDAMELVFTTSKKDDIPTAKTRLVFSASGGRTSPVLTDLKSSDSRISFQLPQRDDATGQTTLSVQAASNWPTGRFSAQITGLCNGLPFIVPVRGQAFGLLVHKPHSWNLRQIHVSGCSPETSSLKRAAGWPRKSLDTRRGCPPDIEGLDISLSNTPQKDGSVLIKAFASEPIPRINKGFFGNVIITTNIPEESRVSIPLMGVVSPQRKGQR